MKTPLIAFDSTSQFREWLQVTKLAGPCSVWDFWTYGHILVEPRQINWTEAGKPKTAICYQWRMDN